jgi:protein involved in polysaccharide export with SLBB domain
MSKHLFGFLCLLLINIGLGQEFQNTEPKSQSIQSLMGLGSGADLNYSQISGSNNLSASINEDEYYVDAGDVFIIKIDVKGPAFKMYNSVVSPEGYLVIPDAPSINVKFLKLKDAKKKINNKLKNVFPSAIVESHLYYIHPIRVTVVGAIPKPVKISLFSNNRLFDAINSAFSISETEAKTDTTFKFNWNSISYRNIDLIHQNIDKKNTYDLLQFKLIGNKKENPYLMDEDIIYIQYKDSIKHHININGSVARPIIFEYKEKDNLRLALQMAGGILPNADSTRVELLRFEPDNRSIRNYALSFPKDSNFVLLPDDRIYVREKYDYHEKYSVILDGALKYPGEYAIDEGVHKLSDIIELAGGFSDKASLRNAKLLRNKNILEDKELKRLSKMTVEEMNDIEISYSRLRSREDARLVSCDFEKLFIQKDNNEDVILRDGDLIIIPEVTKTIFVSGGVISPGYVNLDSKRNYLDYIKLAGGFNERAREGKVKIIKNKSGVWLDAEVDILLEEGDIVFIPESEEIDWYDVFREGLTILTQVGTIVLIVINLK